MAHFDNKWGISMNSLKLVVTLILLAFGINCNAQIEDLPESATGARVLPFVSVDVSVPGSLFWGAFHNSVQEYIWGEAGEMIDGVLDDLGIDIEADAGVLQYNILFEVVGTPLTIPGEIDKLAGETLEEAFQRNYGEGDLEDAFAPASGPGPGGGGGGGGGGAASRNPESIEQNTGYLVFNVGSGGTHGVVTCSPACF